MSKNPPELSVSLNDLTEIVDRILETSRKERIKSSIKQLTKSENSTFKPLKSSNLRVEFKEKGSKINQSNPFMSEIIRNKLGDYKESAETEYWSTPFSSKSFKKGVSKYGSIDSSKDNDFIKRRKKNLLREELESLRRPSNVSKYYFQDLNDLRQKIVNNNQSDVKSTNLHSIPISRHYKEMFDLGKIYKEKPKASRDVSEFIEKNREVLKKKSRDYEIRTSIPNETTTKVSSIPEIKQDKLMHLFELPLMNLDESQKLKKNFNDFFYEK